MVDTKSYFVCDENGWRESTIEEDLAGEACVASKEGAFSHDSIYVCENRNFRKTIFYDYPVDKDWTNPNLEYGTLLDKRDGRVYKTIKVNCSWSAGMEEFVMMAENLNYADSNATRNLKGNNWCYMNDSTNCLKGGRYYSWSAAMDLDSKWNETFPEGLIKTMHRGICPEGWHILTRDETLALTFGNLDESYVAEGIRGSELWNSATNETGLSILPTGLFYNGEGHYHMNGRYLEYEFEDVGMEAGFWTASQSAWHFTDTRSYASWGWGYRHGLSVRCVEVY